MKKIFAILFFVSPQVFGQKMVVDTLSKGNVIIAQDSLVKFLMAQNTAINGEKKTMPGFRIQLASSNNRKNVLDIRATFMQHHPEVKSYFTYQQPYFKLRVGDFQTRLEATRFLQILLKEFDSAFIVPDDISVTDE